jgi:transposase
MRKSEPNLPDDPELLKKIILQQSQELLSCKVDLKRKDARIQILEEYYRLSQLRQFGNRSEKFKGQGELFNEAECFEIPDEQETAKEPPAPSSSRQTTNNQKGRKPLPADLPRIKKIHDLADHEKQCDCGCQLTEIGEEINEQFDVVPLQMRVIQHIRKKYACKACESNLKTSPLPAQPIPKSMASPGLLAHIMVSKYLDALPLHRQERIFARHKIHLPRQTQANWMIQSHPLLQPLLNVMRDELLSGFYVHCDETRVQVLNEKGKSAESQSYMWVQRGGPPGKDIILYDYRDTRSGKVPLELLQDYQGYLMVDGYEGYQPVGREKGITLMACWVHVRRKFFEAKKAQPKPKKGAATPPSKADWMIDKIGQLYAIEKTGKSFSTEDRLQLRVAQSLPLLEEIRQRLDEVMHTVTPSSKLGEAIHYANKYWNRLIRYCEDGRLPIDNNPVENAIRPFVIGRKNWMFSASEKGAHASAGIYSIIETCRANGMEPYHYLRHIFKELPKVKVIEEYESLLPWNLDGSTLVESRLADEGGVG